MGGTSGGGEGGGGLCAGYCGEQTPQECWCDEACIGYGDCCEGVCEDCGSFLSFCEGEAGGEGEEFPYDSPFIQCVAEECAEPFFACEEEEVCGEQLLPCLEECDGDALCQETCTVDALEAGSEAMIPMFQCAAVANCQDAGSEEGGGPNPDGSCAGACGQQSPDGCYCDEACVQEGDCCNDVCDQCEDLSHCGGEEGPGGGMPEAQTCAGSCGQQSPGGCYCDEICVEYGDCCDDVCDECDSLSFCEEGGEEPSGEEGGVMEGGSSDEGGSDEGGSGGQPSEEPGWLICLKGNCQEAYQQCNETTCIDLVNFCAGNCENDSECAFSCLEFGADNPDFDTASLQGVLACGEGCFTESGVSETCTLENGSSCTVDVTGFVSCSCADGSGGGGQRGPVGPIELPFFCAQQLQFTCGN